LFSSPMEIENKKIDRWSVWAKPDSLVYQTG
jgi:hypothetical protein